jgi:hypothetical protein
MNKLLCVIGLCLLISSCGLFSSNKHYSYIKEQENSNLILSSEQQKNLVFNNNYEISKISNTKGKFYPEAPPRPNSQLQLISKTGVVYTWNRKDNYNWIDTTGSTTATIKELKEFLATNNINLDKAKTHSNTIVTELESFYYTKPSKGLLGKLQQKGLTVRTKDEVNCEGRYVISLQTDNSTPKAITSLKIAHESIFLEGKEKKIIPLEDSDRTMSNDLLKKLWLYLGNKI